jgi:large subunit ribosomal protein L4
MQVPVRDMTGQEVKTIELPADIFEVEVNVGLMHQAYVRQMANARQGTHSTLRRGEVDRTKAKIYKQKGTGNARHGSRNAPIFVGGGIAHGPKPRDYTQSMPRKMRQGAIRSALSALLRDGQLVFVDKLSLEAPKTKVMKQVIKALTGGESALVLFTHGNINVQRSVSNLPQAQALLVNNLNMRDLFKYDKVIIPLDALDFIVSVWGKKKEAAHG